MPKAYKVLVKVHSAEIKSDKDQPPILNPRCRVDYDAFIFETRKPLETDQKQTTWGDEFELTYFAKAPMIFTLLALDPVSNTHREMCRGELDLDKRKGQTGPTEVALKNDAKKDKGQLKVSLTWLGDFELTPFRLELVVHTAEVLRRKELGACRVRAQLGHRQVKVSTRDAQETPAKEADKTGKLVWKERLQWIVTTQDELRIELLGKDKTAGQGVSAVLTMSQLLQMKTGVVKKLWLWESLPVKDKPVQDSTATTIAKSQSMTDLKEQPEKKEKREKRGAVWVMLNHNHKTVLDPKATGLAVPEHPERSMSPSQAKVTGTELSKQGLRKWLYEEFKPKHKQKVSLAAMSDQEKEKYLEVQVAALTKLRAHKDSLRDHLEILEDKMDETLAKMREKKNTEEKQSPEEKARKAVMDEKFKEIRRLQVETDKLKEEFAGGSGFDKLKELESNKSMLSKRIAELQKQVQNIEHNNEKRELRLLEIEEKNREEVGLSSHRTSDSLRS